MSNSFRARPRRPSDPGEAVRDIKSGLSAIAERLEQVFSGDASATSSGGSFEIPIGSEKATGVFGVSVRMGTAGLETKTFGNLKPGATGPEVADTREPLVDIFDDPEALTVTLELPGVAVDDVEVAVEEQSIRIKTTGPRRYATEVPFDGAADADALERNHQNGILTLRLPRRDV